MENYSELLLLLSFMIAIGAFAGILAGLLGVGGGIVLVPAFFYLFSGLGYGGEYVMQICLGTSLATIIITSTRSLYLHNMKHAVDWNILKSWSWGIAFGAIIGGFAAPSLRAEVLQAVFGGLSILVAFYLGFARQSWKIADELPKGIIRAILSPLLGLLSVLMGIGGGSLGVPLMSLHNVGTSDSRVKEANIAEIDGRRVDFPLVSRSGLADWVQEPAQLVNYPSSGRTCPMEIHKSLQIVGDVGKG